MVEPQKRVYLWQFIIGNGGSFSKDRVSCIKRFWIGGQSQVTATHFLLPDFELAPLGSILAIFRAPPLCRRDLSFLEHLDSKLSTLYEYWLEYKLPGLLILVNPCLGIYFFNISNPFFPFSFIKDEVVSIHSGPPLIPLLSAVMMFKIHLTTCSTYQSQNTADTF